ncbi:hypothetical protein [Mesorhizobium sp. M0590]|uniref:hypothetical protein n=1 Tax=Mesorhizobium sp. M0590 TaxID=2956966 RepID=UPI00333CCBA6
MIRFDPILTLNRLVVEKGQAAAYDEKFKLGINMIRSEGNSRGKSTIADLIFFALGGDLTSWKDEAGKCDRTLAEVQINGSPLTLKREIALSTTQQPMWIFFGPLEQARNSATEGWQKFGYRRAGERESFTQVLFRTLGLPEVPSEESNITAHQVLRLMYVDQMTPVNRIFRLDQNDSPQRRQAVGDLLCGVFDERIYPGQIRLRQLDREYAASSLQLSGLLKVLRSVDESMDFSDLLSRAQSVEAERGNSLEEIERLRTEKHSDSASSSEKSAVIATLKRDLDRISDEINLRQSELDRLKFAIEDGRLLLVEIERSITQLRQSQRTGQAFGPIHFSFCPSCFTPVAESSDAHTCHLCKTHIDPDQERSRYARMQNELEVQLKESNALQMQRQKDAEEIGDRLHKLHRMRTIMSDEYRSTAKHYSTESEARIELLTRRIGFLDRELIDIERERKVAAEVAQLSSDKEKLNSEITALRENINEWIKLKQRRETSAYQSISRATAEILNKDTANDIGLVHPDGVYYNFTEDRVEINGKSGYSASTLTLIRNAFHLALLVASCRDKQFNYPRFLLLDNVEDKGMTPDRSKNFQRLMVALSQSLDYEHQIIFTTSMPDEGLDDSGISVGEKYTERNLSLKF